MKWSQREGTAMQQWASLCLCPGSALWELQASAQPCPGLSGSTSVAILRPFMEINWNVTAVDHVHNEPTSYWTSGSKTAVQIKAGIEQVGVTAHWNLYEDLFMLYKEMQVHECYTLFAFKEILYVNFKHITFWLWKTKVLQAPNSEDYCSLINIFTCWMKLSFNHIIKVC